MKKVMILIFLIGSSLFAQKRVDAVNVHHDLYNGKVRIFYDLSLEDWNISKIGIQLKKKGDDKYQYTISNAKLEKQVSGKNKTIICDLTEEYKSKLSDNNFYFSVYAIEKDNSSTSSLIWLGVGAIVVGGGMATYIILSKEKSAEMPALPNPPNR